ncbi:PUB3, partial [Symbiodinium sp. CCMP2456]
GQHGADVAAAASVPDPTPAKRAKLRPNRPEGRSIIVLSAFDGIGASHWLVAKAFGRPLLAVSWEVDRACKALVQKAMPWVEHRGDLIRDSPGDVADLVMDADPDALALIVWCAAPPCQDFSRIGQGEGHQGDRGRLFQDSVEFMHELRARVPKHRFGCLDENVDVDRAAAKVISHGLGVQPVFACPSDFGWVSRPRLWWTSDWRRSGHNATMSAGDVPTHHFLGDIVDFILAAWCEGWDPKVFGHDLQNAYRQWAVRFPGHCGTFLPTDQGVTLWFHYAMCFGAAASVWNFNRAADAVQMLMRALLLVLLGHFVDDFNGADDNLTADSAHGVQLHVGAEGVWLSPTEERKQKILAQIDEALEADSLSPDAASRLAGRLTFLSQSTFGCTGRAAIKPLCSRAADT